MASCHVLASHELRNINIRSTGTKKQRDILNGKKSQFIYFRHERGVELQPLPSLKRNCSLILREHPRVIVCINIWYVPGAFRGDRSHEENSRVTLNVDSPETSR